MYLCVCMLICVYANADFYEYKKDSYTEREQEIVHMCVRDGKEESVGKGKKGGEREY